jgi:hypothetical protein
MAAVDQFETMVVGLSAQERTALDGALRVWRADLLAARSEDARIRLVSEIVREIRTLTGNERTATGR